MEYFWGAVLAIALIVVFLLLMLRGWRRLERESNDILPLKKYTGKTLLADTYNVLYAATTEKNYPLKRVLLPKYKFRARIQVAFNYEHGFIIIPKSAATINTIELASIVKAEIANVVIDKGLGTKNMFKLLWVANTVNGSRELDSYFVCENYNDAKEIVQQINQVCVSK